MTESYIARAVLQTLRECGSNLTTAEVAYEVGIEITAAERSLARLRDQHLIGGGGFACGGYFARAPSGKVRVVRN